MEFRYARYTKKTKFGPAPGLLLTFSEGGEQKLIYFNWLKTEEGGPETLWMEAPAKAWKLLGPLSPIASVLQSIVTLGEHVTTRDEMIDQLKSMKFTEAVSGQGAATGKTT
jgi:hypothetical protein